MGKDLSKWEKVCHIMTLVVGIMIFCTFLAYGIWAGIYRNFADEWWHYIIDTIIFGILGMVSGIIAIVTGADMKRVPNLIKAIILLPVVVGPVVSNPLFAMYIYGGIHDAVYFIIWTSLGAALGGLALICSIFFFIGVILKVKKKPKEKG